MNGLGYALDRRQYYRFPGFARLSELSWAGRLFLSLGMALGMGLLAQVRIPLPFTPVPVTGQVFGVLLGGLLLGRMCGALSMGLYLGLGCLGVPWFAAGVSGVLTGPTGGYLVGFIPAAFFVGWATERSTRPRGFIFQTGIMLVGVIIIYTLGALHFGLVMRTSLTRTLQCAVLPFMPVDLFKAALAAAISTSVLSRRWSGGGLDRAQ
jgi:biotin transport system substrate-specific component